MNDLVEIVAKAIYERPTTLQKSGKCWEDGKTTPRGKQAIGDATAAIAAIRDQDEGEWSGLIRNPHLGQPILPNDVLIDWHDFKKLQKTLNTRKTVGGASAPEVQQGEIPVIRKDELMIAMHAVAKQYRPLTSDFIISMFADRILTLLPKRTEVSLRRCVKAVREVPLARIDGHGGLAAGYERPPTEIAKAVLGAAEVAYVE